MAAATKTSVKQHFETGDQPTQAQFSELIDSYLDFQDTLQAIATAAQGGQTGVVIIDSTTDATTAAIGAFGKILITVGATASAIQHLNAMTTDTTQTITGDKTFAGLFRVTAGVTIKNTKSNTTMWLINTDATAATAFTPRINFRREFDSGDATDGTSLGGLLWGMNASAAAANDFTWVQQKVVVASVAASAGGAQVEFWTRASAALEERLRIKQGLVMASATGDDLGPSTINAGRLYDDGRQVTPNQQAFAWATFNGTGTASLTNSINIASLVDNGTGDYSLVFSTAASDAAYGVQIFIGGSTASSPPTTVRWEYLHTATAGGCRFGTVQGANGASAVDFERITVTIWDDNPSQGTRVA
jgi:hypothetical protein